MKYEVFIERPDEEIETIDIVESLEKARFIAYQVPRETYRALGIYKLDKNDRVVDTYCIDIYELDSYGGIFDEKNL